MHRRRAEIELRAAAAGVAETLELLLDAEVRLAKAAAQAEDTGVPGAVIDPLLEAPYGRSR